ncbi:uncharacterized protein FIESC28_00077 [Fusarium coffeatum]|uniref:Uncharacterized protein n=1 Tax=Fusarium coffeatum TaxID=231269 RepID=A0A366SCU0_9HYPO|nr:uncharacterized protein FIESC28_00077 [Fusarium coffeatum]RBR27133.1 hypothetical protein FIESC28_00077 [Fusarium coffeatum]
MSDEQVNSKEPILEEGKFEDATVSGNTIYIRWDVKGGGDRDHYPGFDTWEPLEGTPNIQGLTVRSAVNVWIYLNNDSTDNRFSGPTEGKKKIDARRTSKYKVVQR